MKQLSLASITLISGLFFLLITTTGYDKDENSENGRVDPPSPLRKEYITGEFNLKQKDIEVQKLSAKLWRINSATEQGNFIQAWYIDAILGDMDIQKAPTPEVRFIPLAGQVRN